MKKSSILVSLILFASISVFAADAKKYIADLDPSKDEQTIIAAADWARDNKEEDAVPALVKLLSDSRDMVRLHAVMALGYIGEEDAVEAVNNVMLNDSNPSVRYTALLSTLRIGSEKSMPAWEQARQKETDPFMKDLLAKMEQKYKEKK